MKHSQLNLKFNWSFVHNGKAMRKIVYKEIHDTKAELISASFAHVQLYIRKFV